MKKFWFLLSLLLATTMVFGKSNSCLENNAYSTCAVAIPNPFVECHVWPTDMFLNFETHIFQFTLAGPCPDEVAIFNLWVNFDLVLTGRGKPGDVIQFQLSVSDIIDCKIKAKCGTNGVDYSYSDGCIVVIDGCI